MNLALQIINISHKLRKLETWFFNDYKLMKYEFSTLAIISNVILEKENVCASDIAKINGMSLSAVSRLLNNMESKELIARSIDPDDRRNVIIRITDYGQKIFNEFAESMDKFFDQIFGRLSDIEKPLYNEITRKLIEFTSEELDTALESIRENKND